MQLQVSNHCHLQLDHRLILGHVHRQRPLVGLSGEFTVRLANDRTVSSSCRGSKGCGCLLVHWQRLVGHLD